MFNLLVLATWSMRALKMYSWRIYIMNSVGYITALTKNGHVILLGFGFMAVCWEQIPWLI